ncbi:DUF262 domain-containing HNH endonuclease family protein [Tenacibaculum dicentrarchi]|nr:DUF262 domain-containing HNH endonuclease family protein [Tenacibaculum dicentrarchi]MCD8421211.1 DUF262 domain-containing HNH endonuclease family protein [Tenacibaculum dicentrarchi]MCD8438391.1 DUF262 domain-containing HNH endonuclease family protein [Tenacibaculum dicentrarchi]MCD8452731.1 DUF262 domain-containing HNH endonuclease family protein [Tenacibaculum dicentrarchi]MCG8829073.1 DUF262 domain-containing protein [Tenacibaculum dicentrarchi]
MENLKIDAEISNLKKILADDEKFYQIPDYQRPYSWDKENISDLIDDLVSAFKRNNNENYFCGSIVLVENNNDNRFDVIDGQQRITTFTIIACVFRDLYKDILGKKALKYISNSIQDEYEESKRKLRFLTNEKYQVDFESDVLKEINFIDFKNIERELKTKKYLANAHYVNIFFTEKVQTEEVNVEDFIIWFYENVVLAVITCPSQDSAIQIFNVLNDRGMPLSSIDILKSSLMVKLSSKEDMTAFKSKWENIISNLKFAELDIDSMLNTYLYYKLASNPKNRLDKELLDIFKKEEKDSLEIIKEISDFSDAYIQLYGLQNKYIFCLKYLRHKIYWNAIITTALFENYQDIEKLTKLLVAYYYQNWIAGKTVARIKQTSFNLLKLIKSNSPIEKIKEELKSNLEYYGTTKSFKEELQSSYVYGRRWDRAVLLLVEYFSTDNNKENFIPLSSNLHLEHILPQTLNKDWSEIFTEEETENWTNSLANLTLLSLRKNVQAQNYNFDEKKNAYANIDNVISSFVITQDIMKEDKWNVEALERRKDNLINRIYEKTLVI